MGFGSINDCSVSLIINPVGSGLSEAGDNKHKEKSLVSVESGDVGWGFGVSCVVGHSHIRPTWPELFQAQKTAAL